MKKSSNLQAFSLIELSVVILIIGVLVLGVTQGSRMLREAKLKSARSITSSSPVASIEGLAMWLEATSEKSFNDVEEVDTAIGSTGTITNWYDINPQTTSPNNANQPTSANKPRYIANAINGLPAVNFDGTDDFLNWDGTKLAGSDYTIFIVEQRRRSGSHMIMYGSAHFLNNNLHIGYRADTTFTQAHWDNDLDYLSIPAYTSPTAAMNTMEFDTTNGKRYWRNGGALPDKTEPTQTAALVSYLGARIGRRDSGGYQGDIAEIIIFTRALNNTERQYVESYLSQKWGVPIS